MEIPDDDVRQLFDLVCNSMDFGSGFLESADVELLRDIAARLGVDPFKATPHGFVRNYPHEFLQVNYHPDAGPSPDQCVYCYGPRDHPKHAEYRPWKPPTGQADE